VEYVYEDTSPKSSVGKPFFIAWSLIVVPSLKVHIGAMSNTVLASINHDMNVLLPAMGFLETLS
jgi:hypothetical protein